MKTLSSYVKEGIFDNIARISPGEAWLESASDAGVIKGDGIEISVRHSDEDGGVDEIVIDLWHVIKGNDVTICLDKDHFPGGSLPARINLAFIGATANIIIIGPRGFLLKDMTGFDCRGVMYNLTLDTSGCHVGTFNGLLTHLRPNMVNKLTIGKVDDMISACNTGIRIIVKDGCDVHRFIKDGLAKVRMTPGHVYLDGVCGKQGYTPKKLLGDLTSWFMKGNPSNMSVLSLRDNGIENMYAGDSWPFIYSIYLQGNPLDPGAPGFRLPDMMKAEYVFVDSKTMRRIRVAGKMRRNICVE